MARGGGGDIPGNDLGQRVASSSAFTHVLGAYGARTGAVGGAADSRRTNRRVPRIREGVGDMSSNFMGALSTYH